MVTGLVIRLSVLLSFAASVNSACSSGWSTFSGSCYKVFKDGNMRKNWQNARDYCKQQNAHLAIVMSNEENDYLKAQMRKMGFSGTEQVWMDGTDSAAEGTYIWEATGEYFEISDWGPNEPNQNAGDEDCLTFFARYDFKWNDEHCDKAFPFVCEMEQQSPAVG